MSGDPLDLDATTRRVKDAVDLIQSEAEALRRDTPVRARDPLAAQALEATASMVEDDALALVAEVRRLREFLDEANRQFDGKVEDVVAEMNRADVAEAEVRRLRAQVRRSDEWLAAANAVIRARAIDEIVECCASGSCEVCRR